MLNNYQTTLSINSELLNNILKKYCTGNRSEAIKNMISDYFKLPKRMRKLPNTILDTTLDINDFQNKTNISIRLPEAMLKNIEEIGGNRNISSSIELMAVAVLQAPDASTLQPSRTSSLLYVLGNKFDTRMTDAISHIRNTSNRTWNLSVETCAGGLGIHAQHRFAPTEVVNDDDCEKNNLYKAVQENPRKLIWHCLALDVSEESFKEIKKQKKVSKSTQIDYEQAAYFLYLNKCSYRSTGNTFHSKMTNSKWHDNLEKIMLLHKRIKDTEFTEKDLFKIINKYKKETNVIFIIDPPYLDANVYERRNVTNPTTHGASFGWEEHQKLARRLRSVKRIYGNDFIYFCRITAPKGAGEIGTEARETADKIMKRKIDLLYGNQGFYFVDVPLNDGIIERIITSFPFNGAKEY